MNNTNGKVYLVGAGPGDPGLLTLKGMECIKKADVIIYDYLASPTLLSYAPTNAEIIYVGKKGGDHTLSQDGINNLIKEKAQQGGIVTRLKGGDPFIFGRGGEEAEILVKANIPFEVVPGVTSAIAAPAYAGIPLTHRKFTATLAIVTGHEDPEKKESNIDWEAIAKIGTLVFLMGVKNLPNIAQQLIKYGKSYDTPVALVQWGTTSKQKTVTGSLNTIVEDVKKAGLTSPSIIIVGQVVNLRDTIKWFENRPLLGKNIVVTRAREQASDLVKKLSDLGANCLEYPTIKIVESDNPEDLDNSINNINSYDWIIFTSVNGVNFFFNKLFKKGKDVRALHQIKTACIGPATSKRLLDFGLNSDIIPESYRAESVVEAFKKENIKNKKVLIPRAKDARPILPIELRKMGASVDEVIAYCTKKEEINANLLIENLKTDQIDLITFTSSSTVKNFKQLIPDNEFDQLMKKVCIASIGPITSETAKEIGFNVDITASSFTIQGLCDAILKYYQDRS